MEDWDSVTVLRKKGTTSGTAKSGSALNAARRSGNVVATEKKYGAGSNKTGHGTDLNVAKLDQETEELEHKTVSMDVAKAIQKGRQEKNMTQKDLAVKINEKPNIIQEYEHGKAIPNQQILAKMEKALGIKLRGKDIGEPLTFKRKADK